MSIKVTQGIQTTRTAQKTSQSLRMGQFTGQQLNQGATRKARTKPPLPSPKTKFLTRDWFRERINPDFVNYSDRNHPGNK